MEVDMEEDEKMKLPEVGDAWGMLVDNEGWVPFRVLSWVEIARMCEPEQLMPVLGRPWTAEQASGPSRTGMHICRSQNHGQPVCKTWVSSGGEELCPFVLARPCCQVLGKGCQEARSYTR